MPEGCAELQRKLAAAETYVSEWVAKRVKPPDEAHREKVQKLRAKIDKEMEGFTSDLDTEAMRSAAGRMMEYTNELKDLEYTYASRSKERAEQYQQQLEAHLEDLLRNVTHIARLPTSEAPSRCPSPNHPRPPEMLGEGPPTPPQNENGRTVSPQQSTLGGTSHDSLAQPPPPSHSTTSGNPQPGTRQPPEARRENKETAALSRQPTESPLSMRRGEKRQAKEATRILLDVLSNPAKRRRTETHEHTGEDGSDIIGEETGPNLSVSNTIDFRDVFQDGTAEYKHTIVQYPKDKGDWYILKCAEHNLHFGLSPLHGAAKHIAGRKHGCAKEYTGAITLCGIKVLNCNSSLAEKNNAVTRQAILHEGYMPLGAHWKYRPSARQGPVHKNGGAPTRANHPQTKADNAPIPAAGGRRRDFLGVTDPIAGKIYRGYWAKARNWYGVLVLPRSKFFDDPSFESLSLPEELAETYLSDHIPDCYHSSKQSDGGTRTLIDWEDGFEDGGPCVSDRKFPVLFFDGRIPSQDSVGWLTSRDLENFDPEIAPADDIPHLASIRAYLERRSAKGSQLGQEEMTQTTQSPLHGTFP